MKNNYFIFFISILFFFPICVSAEESQPIAIQNGWKDENGYRYYYLHGEKQVGVQQIEGKFYYFNEKGQMQYAATDGTYYYGRLSGTRQYNCWWDENKDGLYDYYFGADGKRVNGVVKIDGVYYYFKNYVKQYAATDGTYYYGRLSGTRQYNCAWDENKDGFYDYYFGSDGKKVKNTWWDNNQDGQDDYYFGSDYKAVNGVVKIGTSYYYFVNQLKQYATTDGTYYYGRLSGTRQYNCWWDENKDGLYDYYFGSDGKKVIGDQFINGKYYYFDNNARLLYGVFKIIDGKTYYYGRTSGTRQYGWIHYNSNTIYYFLPTTGEMVTGFQTIDGEAYNFGTDGILKTGWQTINGKTYYFYANGTRATYLKKIAGIRYEFSATGELEHSNIKVIADVSAWNGIIDWDTLWNSGEIDGVILRISSGCEEQDSMFENYISNVKRLGIPYGIYIYSNAENYAEGILYANFTNQIIQKYSLNPTLGVYLDLESNEITSYMGTAQYEDVIRGFMSILPTARIYTYLDYANTVLNTEYIRSLITWIAQYNNYCYYTGFYRGWQYTETATLPGISKNVDLSIFYS